MRKMYDFDGWFSSPVDSDGRVRFELLRGTHYECSQSSMVQQLRIASCHRKLRIVISDLGDKIAVVVAPKKPIVVEAPIPTVAQETLL